MSTFIGKLVGNFQLTTNGQVNTWAYIANAVRNQLTSNGIGVSGINVSESDIQGYADVIVDVIFDCSTSQSDLTRAIYDIGQTILGTRTFIDTLFENVDPDMTFGEAVTNCPQSGSGSGGGNGGGGHTVVTHLNTNTGQVATTSVPSSITPSGQSWFDKTFFTGAGTLTGAAVGILVVLGAIVITQKR